MNTAETIRERIEETPAGEPLPVALFQGLGSRAAVDQALSRLVKAGEIERVARGVYMRPRGGRFGPMPPPAIKVARALAEPSGAAVQVSGAEAASRLGLSTQVPARPVFWTSGPSRRVRMGKQVVELRHKSPRKLALAGRPAGLALTALWYLGKGEVTPEVIEKLRKRLPSEEFEALAGARGLMPAWMADAFYRHEQERQSA